MDLRWKQNDDGVTTLILETIFDSTIRVVFGSDGGAGGGVKKSEEGKWREDEMVAQGLADKNWSGWRIWWVSVKEGSVWEDGMIVQLLADCDKLCAGSYVRRRWPILTTNVVAIAGDNLTATNYYTPLLSQSPSLPKLP
ncbi:hypothetical protein L1887_16458 [Cichorium endivia]|nr:hypothetical protein L1887_16458 [Cichorium endivia]